MKDMKRALLVALVAAAPAGAQPMVPDTGSRVITIAPNVFTPGNGVVTISPAPQADAGGTTRAPGSSGFTGTSGFSPSNTPAGQLPRSAVPTGVAPAPGGNGGTVYVPVPIAENPAYYFQNIYNSPALGSPAQPQAPIEREPPLPPADEKILDHTEALTGLIDTDTGAVRAQARAYRLVDSIRVLEADQARTLREQIIDSPVATGNQSIITRHLRALGLIQNDHVVVGIMPRRKVILVGVRTSAES